MRSLTKRTAAKPERLNCWVKMKNFGRPGESDNIRGLKDSEEREEDNRKDGDMSKLACTKDTWTTTEDRSRKGQ